jgi:hypothetical protein
MNELTQDFIEIKTSLNQILRDMIQVYLSEMWDNEFMYVHIMKEMQNLIKTELVHEFPDFPVDYLPQVKLRFDSDEQIIEAGIQQFLNQDQNLIFLGNVDVGENNYDLYCRKSFDPRFDYVFFARYGHTQECIFKGSKSAAADYMLGKQTPLSVAFGMAVEEGFVS